MSTQNIIDVITAKTDLKQMDIAKKLGVSRAQISKWRAGEDIPYNRRQALNEMAGLFGDDTEWALLTKTPENAENWIKYFSKFQDGYLDVDCCAKLSDEPENCVPYMIALFSKVGIKIPEKAPDMDTELSKDDDSPDHFWDLMNAYLESFAALSNWYERNINCIDCDDIFKDRVDLESYIIDYAITHVDRDILANHDADLAKVEKVTADAKKKMSEIIGDIINTMLRNNIPIMKDYFDLINKEPYDLDDDVMFNSIVGCSSLESCLPLYERTVLEQSKTLVKMLTELHVKVDMLLKPEDREKLSKALELTPPLSNIHLMDPEKVDSKAN